jgi:hypothetical protein
MQKISIKPNPNTDRVNLDINLRLVDFLNDKNMLSYDNFNSYNQSKPYKQFSNKNDTSSDPLERHIKKFEQSARSFPVVMTNNQRRQPQQLASAPNRDFYNNNNRKLPDQSSRKPFGSDSELQTNKRLPAKDGYAAQLIKSQAKPTIKPHTVKDFRQYKRNNRLTHGTTGKLGFDFDNESYKEKVSVCNLFLLEVNLKNTFLLFSLNKPKRNRITQ